MSRRHVDEAGRGGGRVRANATGRALLAKFGRLTTVVTVRAGGLTLRSAKVDVQKLKRKR